MTIRTIGPLFGSWVGWQIRSNIMNRTFIKPTIAWCVFLSVILVFLGGTSAAGQEIPNQVIVTFDEGTFPPGIIQSLGDSLITQIEDHFIVLVGFDRFPSVMEAVHFYEGLDVVIAAQPNRVVNIPQSHQISHGFLDDDSESYVESVSPGEYYLQTAAYQVGCPSAHETATGAGITVSIVDNGCDPAHALLQGHLLPDGYDFWSMDDDPSPDSGEVASHGTFVAGMILRAAPDVMLLPIRSFDGDGSGTVFAAAAGIEYSIDAGVDIINLSFGMDDQDALIDRGLQRAADSGIVVIASAGNDSLMEPAPFPASDSTTIAVAAVDDQDIKTAISNYGTFIDVCAPGQDLYGPFIGSDAWGYWQGTSFAAGWVSGLAALLREKHPAEAVDWIRGAIEDGCDDISAANPGMDGLLGAGRVYFPASLNLAMGACNCLLWGDVNYDDAVNPVDMVEITNYVYKAYSFSQPPPPEWNCPYERGDVNCSGGQPNPVDVVVFVNMVYKGFPAWPCAGCP